MADKNLDLVKKPASNEMTWVQRGYPHGFYYLEEYDEGYGYKEAGGHGNRGNVINLRELWWAIRKYKWLIVLITLIATLFVTVEALRSRSTYSASTIIEIRKDTSILNTPVSDSDPENSIVINTKMLMFSSRPLLEETILKLKLYQNPEFLDVSRTRTRWETIRGFFMTRPPSAGPAGAHTTSDTSPDVAKRNVVAENKALQQEQTGENSVIEDARLDPYVGVLEGGLNVTHLRDTQALKVSFTHPHPEIAAMVVNGVTQAFIRRNFEAKTDRFAHASEWLDRSTMDLEDKVKAAEQELANYTRDHNMFMAQGQPTLTTEKLMALHQQAMRADIDLMLKQSVYEEVKKGNVDRLPDAFSDPKMIELQKKLDDLSIRAAQLSVSYGEENPNLQEVRQQMAVIQQQIAQGRRTLEEKLKTDYNRALRDSQTLRASLEQAKGEAVQQDQASIQYNILKQNVDTAKSLYTEFLHKTNQAKLDVAQQNNNIRVIKPARVPKAPDSSDRQLTILLGFSIGLICSIGLAYGLTFFDKTIRSLEDLTQHAQLPALGVIPAIPVRNARLLSANKKEGRRKLAIIEKSADSAAPSGEDFFIRFIPPHDSEGAGGDNRVSGGAEADGPVLFDDRSAVAEAYRAIRTSVLLSPSGNHPKTVLVTSAHPDEGKTTTIINTAISLAQLGKSVLIVDADLRNPSAHKGFGLGQEPGLSTYLSDEIGLERIVQKLQIPNLSLIPSGQIPRNPSELVGSDKMKELLQILAERYDHILIDSPPLMSMADSVILSTVVDGVILVVHGGKSTRDIVSHSRRMLQNVGANIVGMVLNNVEMPRHRDLGFGYYLGYGPRPK